MISEISIIASSDLYALEKDINELLKKGWKLHNGIVVGFDYEWSELDEKFNKKVPCYIQTMIRM